jgi:hypothetical protein
MGEQWLYYLKRFKNFYQGAKNIKPEQQSRIDLKAFYVVGLLVARIKSYFFLLLQKSAALFR